MASLAASKSKSTIKYKRVESEPKFNKPATSKSASKPGVAAGLKRKAPTVALEPESESESDEEEESPKQQAENENEDTHLQGFSTDEDSSDDGGDEAPELPGIDLTKLPTIAKDDATVKRRLERAKREPTQDRGVLFLGQIPHGFYEDEMRAYFSQFGDVTRLRLSRNKKVTQFSTSIMSLTRCPDGETMDNYLLMGRILQCKIIPKEQLHPELWVGANRKWRSIPRDRIFRVQHNKRVERKLLKKQEDRQAKIRAMGIDYEIGAAGYVSLVTGLDSITRTELRPSERLVYPFKELAVVWF
ncbi:RNA binding protein [Rhizoctonia solani AG-1 IA]|uniref:RNA binding protein n=1 Tax=Thanatephorus cucumeris (strain AG1-IA) TaxID=983506 RepID=L8WVC1_THACA|nr:RNA binding protein [Rhizoctonia solani AG-1 IA]